MSSPLVLINVKAPRSGDFSLEIKKLFLVSGEITCITGANGSGKTTLLEVVTGLLIPADGTVKVFGLTPSSDSLEVKKSIGYIPDDDGWIIPELTAREYFVLLESLYKRAGVRHNLTRQVNKLARNLLFNSFGRQLGTLSHGNRKKVQIIAGLMHKPQLLVIDELRNGLDPIAIKRAEMLIKRFQQNGTTILASTHDLWWAERFSDRVIMVSSGTIAYQEQTDNIINNSGSVEAKFMELYA